jgi:hypothetical protein
VTGVYAEHMAGITYTAHVHTRQSTNIVKPKYEPISLLWDRQHFFISFPTF